MIKPAQKFQFGPWLPDLPELDNPGLLEASNLLWVAGSYQPYSSIVPSGFALPGGIPLAAIRCPFGGGSVLFVASTDGSTFNYLSASFGSSFNFINLTGPNINFPGPDNFKLAYSPNASFAQYGSTVIYADGVNLPQYNTADPGAIFNAGRSFSALTGPNGNAPVASFVGVVGQFVVLANLTVGQAQTSLQWSSINQPFNWPTPGSAQAIASQSGTQFLDFSLGILNGIAYGDQAGVILLSNGLERMQYVGGDTVFQFAEIYRGPSSVSQSSWVKAANIVFSCAGDGFIATDGVSVKRIGDAKVDRWFQQNVNSQALGVISAGFDPQKKLVYWTFPQVGTGSIPNAWIAYNYAEDKWTHGTDGIACFVKAEETVGYLSGYGMQGFTSAAAPGGGGFGGTLTGTPGTAVITTAETELNPGGRAVLQGFRPQIAGLPGGAMTVQIGSRTRLGDQVAFTPQLQVNGQTNFADALVDANYHRAQVTLNGNFTQAIGGEFKAIPSGQW